MLYRRLLVCFAASATGTLALAQPEMEVFPSEIAPTAEKITSSCDFGGIKYDDGNFENGYRFGTTLLNQNEFAMRFDPAAPGRVEDVCVCFQSLAVGGSVQYDIRVWDADGPGGSPGTLLGELSDATLTGIPFGLTGKFHSVDLSSLNIDVDGPFYIGAQWFPGIDSNEYICADESPATPLQPAYSFVGLIEQAPTTPLSDPDYRALGIRARLGEPPACVADEDTLCLVNGRFKVEIEWETNTEAGTGQARTIPGVDFSGLFWFFNSDNLEMLVKVLDACALNQKFWVFYAATTNVGFDMTITDTATGAEKVYRNNRGAAAPPVQDTEAFSCPVVLP